jgi:hypothetical protein
MAKSSPTQRSLALLRERGFQAEVTERWNPFARIRQDLFGWVDILALGDGKTWAIQTTSRANMASRAKKIADSPVLPEAIRAGWRIEVWGWDKDSKGHWRVKILEIA